MADRDLQHAPVEPKASNKIEPKASNEEGDPESGRRHRPVLVREVVEGLGCRPGITMVDATVGDGGHAEAMLEAASPDGRLIGFDRDPDAVARAVARLARFGERATVRRAAFGDLGDAVRGAGVGRADAILFDLGVSSRQLEDPERGFSFQVDGPLDMRMDPDLKWTAADLVNDLSAADLARLIRTHGEERWAARIGAAIVRARERAPLRRTLELAEVISSAVPAAARRGRIHPATRTFQALRIAVNDEAGQLERGLDAAVVLLPPGGRVAVLSFHSLEDRVVKERFRALSRGCICPPRFPVCACGRRPLLKVLTARPIGPSARERSENPRSRSARLRIAERVEPQASNKIEPQASNRVEPKASNKIEPKASDKMEQR